ncbi:DUF2516 family protein [Isoptericola jiangsuensis]|uniref:DUF2516 family protein n=1 Tax=Isoptericola jiangsuensis TaxID=548579 RepID=UPI003AAED522
MLGNLQLYVLIALAVVVFVVQAYAFFDAARRPAQGYKAEGKLTKPIWLLILGVALALGFLGLPPMMLTSRGFLNLIAVVAAIVYLVDVRPRLQPYSNGRGRPQRPSGW